MRPVGTGPADESSKVSVAFEANARLLVGSPTSDSTTRFPCPFGATTMASMSLTAEWVRLLKVTVTLLRDPANPETAMPDGYGLACPIWLAEPAAGMAIELALENVVGPAATAAGVATPSQPTATSSAVNTG